MTDIEDRLESIEQKIDKVIQLLDKFGNSSSNKTAPKGRAKKTVAPKIDQFKLSTQDLLDSEEPLCAYMQRSEDCEGHCGKPATYSVIRDHPIALDDLEIEDSKNEKAENLRKSFLRCNGCKTKAQKAENSRAYKVVKKFLYKQTGEDTAVAADLDAMMGSPSRNKGKKNKNKKKKDNDDDEPGIKEGLDNPENYNENLIKTDKWFDKFVKVGKKNMIVRSYNDKRKKEVCIGLIDAEPEDDQYEETLRKPAKTFLEKVGLKYLSPEDAARGTPPKADKRTPTEDSDDEDSTVQKTKRKSPKTSKQDSDEEDDEEEKPVKPKGKKGKDAKKKTSKQDSDEEDDEDDGEAEAFQEMGDSD